MFTDDHIIRGLSEHCRRLEADVARLEAELAYYRAKPNTKWFAFDDHTKTLKPLEDAQPCTCKERSAH